MSGVPSWHDLETLRGTVSAYQDVISLPDVDRHMDAADRVEALLREQHAENARLREERDMARAGRDQWERDAKGRGVVQYELLARAQAAETELATATTTAELAIRQLEAAEAEMAQLKQSIKTIVKEDGVVVSRQAREIARLREERDAAGMEAGSNSLTIMRQQREIVDLEARCARLQQALAQPCAECGHIDWRELA